MKRRISILGSTGSIGVSTLEVIAAAGELFEVVGLAAGYNVELLKQQIQKFHPKKVSVAEQALAEDLKKTFPECEVHFGKTGLIEISTMEEADFVVSALVGAKGIRPTVEAILAKKDVALANKEVLVSAGELIMELVREQKIRMIPVDSEHSAIFQICSSVFSGIFSGHEEKQQIEKIILTASGGPFLNRPQESWKTITPEEALKHPRWTMGERISVDSATLMNKGFEVIEAHWLFGLPPEKIDVVIHPQSIVHGLVLFSDGNMMGCLSVPDMKAPIAYALSYPRRIPTEVSRLDLTKVKELTFDQPDIQKFPLLQLAYKVLKQGGAYPCLLNAADEIAVEAFLKKKIQFDQIPQIVNETLSSYKGESVRTLEEILEVDEWGRRYATEIIKLLC